MIQTPTTFRRLWVIDTGVSIRLQSSFADDEWLTPESLLHTDHLSQMVSHWHRGAITHQPFFAMMSHWHQEAYYTPTSFRRWWVIVAKESITYPLFGDEYLAPGSLLHTNLFSQMMNHWNRRIYHRSSATGLVLWTGLLCSGSSECNVSRELSKGAVNIMLHALLFTESLSLGLYNTRNSVVE